MDTLRLIAFMVFIFSGYMLFQAWEKQHQPIAKPQTTVSQSADGSVPSAPKSADVGKTAASSVPGALESSSANTGQLIKIKTDRFEANLSTRGGDLVQLSLPLHRASKLVNGKEVPFPLLVSDSEHFYVTQSGLIGTFANIALPNHKSVWVAERDEYTLTPEAKELVVVLVNRDVPGLEVTKRWTFNRGSYLVDVRFEVKNTSGELIDIPAYFQFARDGKTPKDQEVTGGPFSAVAAYHGPAYFTAEKKFQKIDFSTIDKRKTEESIATSDGWVGMTQHYFVGAWMPKQGDPREIYTRRLSDGKYTMGVLQPAVKVQAGQVGFQNMRVYLGPQEQTELEALAKSDVTLSPGLEHTVDYGIFTIFAKPIFAVLQWIHSHVGNWGWAIILLTVLIKTILYPLNAAAGRSMANMKELTPKMEVVRERYKGDPQKMNQAMMELYRTEKVNPLGGCLPMVMQMPIFLALYWVLLGAIELRHAPWMGWIKDLSAADPIFVLPVLYAITMFIQTRVNPQPADPMQAKVMMFMPIIFSVFFLFFPAGLVLYWLVQNVITIAQQWYINRTVKAEQALKKSTKR